MKKNMSRDLVDIIYVLGKILDEYAQYSPRYYSSDMVANADDLFKRMEEGYGEDVIGAALEGRHNIQDK